RSHLEAQAGRARGGCGAFRRLAIPVRGQSQPARIRHRGKPLHRLPKIAFRDDMADRWVDDHGFDLPRTVARTTDTYPSLVPTSLRGARGRGFYFLEPPRA